MKKNIFKFKLISAVLLLFMGFVGPVYAMETSIGGINVTWPCDPTLTNDMSCEPNSQLMTCLKASESKIAQDPYGTIDLCYEKYDANERDKAGLVANQIVKAIQEGTKTSDMPCTSSDPAICKMLYQCISERDNPQAKLACYDTYSTVDKATAQKKLGDLNLSPKPTTPAQPAAQPLTEPSTLSYKPLEPLPGLERVQDLNFASFLGLIFKLLISIGAILSVVTLVYAGISYILSEAFETKGEAKNRMKAALFGMVILLGAWLLLNTVNPALLNFDLSSIGTIRGNTPQGTEQTTPDNSVTPSTSDANTCESGPNPGVYQPKPGGGFICKR